MISDAVFDTVYLPGATRVPLTVQMTAAGSFRSFDRVYEPLLKHPIWLDAAAGVTSGSVGRHSPGLIVTGKVDCATGASLYLVVSNVAVTVCGPGATGFVPVTARLPSM